MSAEKVTVQVQYVGKDPFEDELPKEAPLNAIKRKAMHEFELEQNSADRYVLVYNGAVLTNENTTLDTFGAKTVLLTLQLKEETEKG